MRYYAMVVKPEDYEQMSVCAARTTPFKTLEAAINRVKREPNCYGGYVKTDTGVVVFTNLH